MGQRRAQCPSIGGAQRVRVLEAENAKLLATLLAVLAIPRTSRERDEVRLAIAFARQRLSTVAEEQG
jgi:hypothetical protein